MRCPQRIKVLVKSEYGKTNVSSHYSRSYTVPSNLLAPVFDAAGTPFRTCAPRCFAPRQFYSKDLKHISSTQSSRCPVGSTKHHVIPKHQLRRLWNEVVMNPEHIHTMRPLFIELLQTVPANHGLEALVSNIDDIRALTPKQCNSAFLTFLWNTGNVFVGPGTGRYRELRYWRLDDPGWRFDEAAKEIFYGNGSTSQRLFDKLQRAHVEIDQFTKHQNEAALIPIIDALGEAASQGITVFQSEQWEIQERVISLPRGCEPLRDRRVTRRGIGFNVARHKYANYI